jgi:hypothetical protein
MEVPIGRLDFVIGLVIRSTGAVGVRRGAGQPTSVLGHGRPLAVTGSGPGLGIFIMMNMVP